MNLIQQENAKLGTRDWQLTSPILPSDRDSQTKRCRAIEGYASLTSVNIGKTIKFHVSTTANQFSLQVFRLGWYGGLGGRQMTDAVILPGKDQPTPAIGQQGLIECNWPVSHTLTVPPDWVSGVYVAKLTAQQTRKQSYIIFVVRDDDRASAYLFQSSVTTFQAYNNWGGKSIYFYNCNSTQDPSFFLGSAARTVSFNRPYAVPEWSDGVGGAGAGDFFTHDYDRDTYDMMKHSGTWEYNMVRWLEAEGYDVTYCTNIDTHDNPELLSTHRGFLSVGHDEYWSQEMRDHVVKARDRGVNLAFFSANSVYWRIQMQPSTVTQKPNRNFYVNQDSIPGTNLRQDLFQARQQPEETLMGASWRGGHMGNADIIITNPEHWICKDTGLQHGSTLRGLVGYEFNGVYPENNPPSGLTKVADSIIRTQWGNDFYESPYAMTVYQVASGAIIFSANTVQWSWGLDDYSVPGVTRVSRKDPAAQQMTRNVLNRFVMPRGAGYLAAPNEQGTMQMHSIATGWRSTWHSIVPGQFSNNSPTDLLFYDAFAGEICFFSTQPEGILKPIAEGLRDRRKTWHSIVPGKFSDGAYTDVLCYDATKGEMAFYSTNGKGQLSRMPAGKIDCRQTWSLIIPGDFGSGTYTDLLCYDATKGEIAFYATDGRGNLTPIGTTQLNHRRTWSRIVPGHFSGSAYKDLLFYDATTGEGAFYSTYGSGELIRIGPMHDGWRKTWQAIVPGNFVGGGYTNLLFYDPVAKEGVFFSPDGLGSLSESGAWNLSQVADLRHIVPINSMNLASHLSGLLLYSANF